MTYVINDSAGICSISLSGFHNIRDVQRKNVVNNVDMSSLRAPCQHDPYKNNHTEQHKAPTRNMLHVVISEKIYSSKQLLMLYDNLT